VATKGDKLPKGQLKAALDAIMKNHGLPEPPILTSADEKKGREEVLEQLGMLLAGDGG
jgi:GTP-binding protein EngB required for normal cell division